MDKLMVNMRSEYNNESNSTTFLSLQWNRKSINDVANGMCFTSEVANESFLDYEESKDDIESNGGIISSDNATIERMTETIQNLKSQITTLKKSHRAKLSDQEAEYKAKILAQEKRHKTTVVDVVTQLKSFHEEKIQSNMEKLKSALDEHDALKHKLKGEEDRTKVLEQMVAELITSNKKETEYHETALKNLDSKHAQTCRAISKQLISLKMSQQKLMNDNKQLEEQITKAEMCSSSDCKIED